MATAAKSRKRLPLPWQVTEKRCDEIFLVDYGKIAEQAREYRKQHNLKPAASDKFRICVLTIDGQIDFCQSHGALYVLGAQDDMARTCNFKLQNLDVITTIVNTIDTHTAFQIFHPTFFVNDAGEHPSPMTAISVEDIRSGKWKLNPAAPFALRNPGAFMALQKHIQHYVETLEKNGRYALMVWPFHCMLGGIGHALVPAMSEVDFFHAEARGNQTEFAIKGGNPLSENYSPFELEVATKADGSPIGQKNTGILNLIVNHDAVFIMGQAKSHCVAWAIDSILNHINGQDPELAKKIYLVEDCTSPVKVPAFGVDFTPQADAAFARFKAAGMNVVQSTTPLETYLPL